MRTNLITTARLNLCHVSKEDARFIIELLNTPGWIQFISNRNSITTLEAAENYIVSVLIKGYEMFGFGLYLVKLKGKNISIGLCGLVKRGSLEHADIGFAFLPEFFGKGYAFESAVAVIKYAVKNLGMKKVLAITNTDNIKSVRLLEKLGLKFEKKIRLPGESKEVLLYSLKLNTNAEKS